MRKLIPLLLAALFAAAAHAQVYRWTDANGRVHYGERAPPGAKARPVESRISTYTGPPIIDRVAAAAKPAAAGTAPEITMYATAWCTYCKQAREYFARKGVRYTERDIEQSAQARAEYDRLGGRGVPVILVGAQRMVGFSPGSMDQMLKSSGF